MLIHISQNIVKDKNHFLIISKADSSNHLSDFDKELIDNFVEDVHERLWARMSGGLPFAKQRFLFMFVSGI